MGDDSRIQDAGGAEIASTCPVCGRGAVVEGRRVLCGACNLDLTVLDSGVLARSVDPRTIAYPESGNALAMEVEDESFWFRHRNRVITALLQRYPPAGPIWDVGGGNGFQTRHLERAGYDVVMVEPGPVGCENARGRGVGTVIRSTLEELALPSHSIAALGYFDLLEHLEDPHPLLHESLRVLRSGGRAYLAVPAYNWLWSHEDTFAEHKRRYTARTLSDVLGLAGFDVEYLSYYFRPLVIPVFLLRALPYRMSKRKGSEKDSFNPGEHTPSGLARSLIDHLLEREHRWLASGSRRRVGASLLCVARRP
jgi:SAM-dependent methyltransferase